MLIKDFILTIIPNKNLKYNALECLALCIMWDYHRGTGFVCHTKDYWVRDFMPVQVYQNVFAKFIFTLDYLQDKKKYITDVDKVINNCPFVKDYTFVNIPLVLDGGNMVFCKGYDGIEETSFVIMTEKVLYENPNYDKLKTPAVVRKRGRRLCMLTLFRQNLLAVLNND